ncbi:MAG: BREX-4 system phosphatase PglZ [Acetatifactor sp.]|nr:BREX-4 system phosphatase PglZ [Acetatifactor sp.]
MDIDEIKRKITEDKEKVTASYRRYPVRFVFMEMSNKTQDEIMDIVKSTDGDLLELSDYIMKKDDGWMTKSRFVQIIRNHTSKTKDTYVLGFSELIRFFSKKEIESTVLSLFDIENQNIMDATCSRRRIYFVCFSMVDNVYRVLQNSFPRKDLLDPFINSDYEASGLYREVCFVSKDYANNIKKNKITSSVEWIGLWRHSEVIDFSAPIWCCSENLYEWYKHKKASPDNAFQIDVVQDTKDYLRKAYDVDIEFPYTQADAEYWNRLKDACAEQGGGKAARDLIGDELGVDVNSSPAIAGRLLTTEDGYVRWLIRSYVGTYMADSFLAKTFKTLKSNSNKEFLITIWKQGYWTDDVRLLEERVSIIKELNKYADSFTPEKEIQATIFEGVSKELSVEIHTDSQNDIQLVKICEQTGRDISELRSRLLTYYLRIFKPAYTGLSNAEKEFVINLYSNNVLDKAEIQGIYPALYTYLFGTAESVIVGEDEWKLYLQAYRESKVTGKDNAYLKQYYESGCANSTNLYSMYYAIPRQEVAVAPYINDSDIYILDGVGAEYLPLLVELIRNKGYEIEACDYAACHLPSITTVNKDYLSSLPYKEWILTFDRDVVHGEFYRTALNLRKAFDILESVVKDIIAESEGRKIVITADHGATARAKWTGTKKKYDFSTADHEGRCCKINNKSEYSDTEDYIVYEDEVKPGTPFVISLNETSLYNRPRFEDHGGATAEEMLVPVIVAVPGGNEKKKIYKVLDEKLEVTGLDKKVSFVIIPDPDEEVYVIEADGEKHTLEIEGTHYVVDLKSGREQDISVVVEGTEYKFHTINRSKKNMEGDDGFDD